MNEAKTMTRTCVRCGKKFEAKKSGNRWYRYCSIECTREAGKARVASGSVMRHE